MKILFVCKVLIDHFIFFSHKIYMEKSWKNFSGAFFGVHIIQTIFKIQLDARLKVLAPP